MRLGQVRLQPNRVATETTALTDASAVIVAAFVSAIAALWIGFLQYRALRAQNAIALLYIGWRPSMNLRLALGKLYGTQTLPKTRRHD